MFDLKRWNVNALFFFNSLVNKKNSMWLVNCSEIIYRSKATKRFYSPFFLNDNLGATTKSMFSTEYKTTIHILIVV